MRSRRLLPHFSLVLALSGLLACAPAGSPAATAPAEARPASLLPASPSVTAAAAPPLGTPPASPVTPAALAGAGYDLGQPTLTELYLSPAGDDANPGDAPAAPLRTLQAAWAKIPAGAPLTGTGYRLNFLPGEYPCEPAEPDNCQNYFADRHGTYAFPILLRAAAGPGTVTVRGGLDLSAVSYLYLLDLTLAGGAPLPTNQSGNNLLHLAGVDHILLRGVTLAGPAATSDTLNNLQEVLKVNQAQYLYVEDSVIGGAWHSSVDFFSVQYGHFLNNRVHTAGQWCFYLKGGSAYLRVDGNEFSGCQLGFQAGQSSNLAVMRTPWVHYEAYDIKFVNNVLHEIPGVGLSVSGGYNVLFAHNTLYRVGYSTDPGYALFQAVLGMRGCNATTELPDPLPVCLGWLGQGGWGPNVLTDNLDGIPNRNVYFYNNLVYNPAPAQTLYTHFNIAGPLGRPASFQNLPATLTADANLVIAGNLIWNGPRDHPLGVDDTTGCASGNPLCNATQLALSNTINSREPALVDPGVGNFRPVLGGSVFSAPAAVIPDFTWDPFAPAVPAGTLTNAVSLDRAGQPRPSAGPPGAYSAGAAAVCCHVFLARITK